jgi:hypothetical protein
VLAVVQHQWRRRKAGGDGPDEVGAGSRAGAGAGRDGLQEVVTAADGRRVDPGNVPVADGLGHQPGLADAARPGHGHQPAGTRQDRQQCGQLPVAAEKGGEIPGYARSTVPPHQGGPRCSTGPLRRRRADPVVTPQQRGLQLPDSSRRIQPEHLDDRLGMPAQHRGGLGGRQHPGQHQHTPLPARISRDLSRQPPAQITPARLRATARLDAAARPGHGEARADAGHGEFGPVGQGRAVGRAQPGRPPRQHPGRELRQRRPPPQRQRPVEQLPPPDRIAAGPRLPHQPLEAERVHLLRRDHQPIPGRLVADGTLRQHRPQPGHV